MKLFKKKCYHIERQNEGENASWIFYYCPSCKEHYAVEKFPTPRF